METTSWQPPGTEKRGLSRIWKKFRSSFSDKQVTPATTSTPTPSKPNKDTKAVPTKEPTIPEPQPDTVIKTMEVDVPAYTDEEAPMQNDVSRRFEKARALFKKYNFDIDESEWKWEEIKSRPTERVQKNIRMRVKYTCHNCSTIFGHDKVCISCEHPRCSKCVRYPAKKPKVKKEPITATSEESASEKTCACHECQTDFDGTDECPNCQHKICEQCLKQALVAVSPSSKPPTLEKKAIPPEEPATAPAAVVAS